MTINWSQFVSKCKQRAFLARLSSHSHSGPHFPHPCIHNYSQIKPHYKRDETSLSVSTPCFHLTVYCCVLLLLCYSCKAPTNKIIIIIIRFFFLLTHHPAETPFFHPHAFKMILHGLKEGKPQQKEPSGGGQIRGRGSRTRRKEEEEGDEEAKDCQKQEQHDEPDDPTFAVFKMS